MKSLTELMFWISNGLLVPVVVGLLFFFCKALIQGGSFFSQYLYRSRQQRQVDALLEEVEVTGMEALAAALREMPPSPFLATMLAIHERRDNPAWITRSISAYELRADAELGKTRLLTKFGPILGLMGTLIPMGPALVGLSTGDIASMAYNMQIVFATTVLGLLTGAIGYLVLQVKQRWMASDLASMDYLSDLLQQQRAAT
jgi:biopolymer transport protein ExbB/TolQ